MCSRAYFIMILFSLVLAGKKYKVTLISAEKCPASKADDRTAPVDYSLEVTKLKEKTVVKTNYNILRTVGPVLINFRLYQIKHNPELMFKLEKMNCHSPFTFQLVRMVNLKMDGNCMAEPGNYTTKYINPQDFAWIIGKSAISSGKYLYELEFNTAKGRIAACVHVICDIKIN